MRNAGILLALISCVACGDSGSPEAPPLGPSPGSATPTPGAPTQSTGSAASAPAASSGSGASAPGAGSSSAAPGAGTSSTPAPSATVPNPSATNTADAGVAADAGKTPEKLAMDECGLDTGWDGDEYCILPPPPDKGFQIHIGPSNYQNPESQYLVDPGKDEVSTLTAVSSNTTEVNYYYRQYRMRPGSHHVILSTGGIGGRRVGGTQNLAKDNPTNGVIPPENEGVGLPLAARSQISVNLHYFNGKAKPILKEVWVNFWYKDPAKVKETALEIFSMTGVTAATAGSHVVVGASCPITQAGRVLSLYGHRHYNNVRFSAWRVRGGQREVVINDYDAAHPGVLEYNSLTKNQPVVDGIKGLGGFSGILDLMPGDKLDFECEIINKTTKNFTGANEANDDEMCILVGDSVGTKVPTLCSAIQPRYL
jgi:hypothetical protein